MEYGVCGNPEMAACAAEAGFDFFEWSVGGFLQPRESRDHFLAALETVQSAGLPCPVLNCFLPSDLKITGPVVDAPAVEAYVETALSRAAEAGVEVIVFGSGGARAIPEGFDADTAHGQLVGFCVMLAQRARHHGVTIVVEPLSRTDCNVLTTVGECAALVREIAQPGFALLVDSYHFMRNNDSYDDIAANGGMLRHVHTATLSHRRAPGVEPCDLNPFFSALAAAGYDGRVSIEAAIADPAQDLQVARAHLVNRVAEAVGS